MSNLETLTTLAREARAMSHEGQRMVEAAERIETALDALAEAAGVAVADIYAALAEE